VTAEFILQLLTMGGACVAVYAAIRADLARLNERTNRAIETADQAHARIDSMMQRDHK
jgi:hypothetical protein